MILFENVSKTYDGKNYVLNNLNLNIDDGEFVFIMGPSGAGKTTLTKLLLREEKLTEGRLYFNKFKLHKLPARKIPYLRREMGYVFQDFRLFQNKTVYENVAYAMEVVGEPKRHIKKRVPIALEIVGLTGKEKVMPKELSGGEKQRLCVARAIVNNPSVIVADEPTGNLDIKLAKEIMDLLVKISEFNKTVIVVTHANDLVSQYNKRVVTIEKGCLVSDTIGLTENSSVSQDNTAVFESSTDSNFEVSPAIEPASVESDEMAKDFFNEENDEGSSIFNTLMGELNSDIPLEKDRLVYDDFGVTDNDAEASADSADAEYILLFDRQKELNKRSAELKDKIAGILASGSDSADETLDDLRASLKEVTDEIDSIDKRFSENATNPRSAENNGGDCE